MENSFDDLGLLNLKTIRTSKVHSTTSNKCICRFAGKCTQSLVDSGCSAHVTGNLNLLTNVRQPSPVQLETAFARKSQSTTKGDLYIMLTNNTYLEVKDIIYSPEVEGTLLSTKQLADQGISTSISRDGLTITLDGHRICKTLFRNGGYVLHSTTDFDQQRALKIGRLSTVNNTMVHGQCKELPSENQAAHQIQKQQVIQDRRSADWSRKNSLLTDDSYPNKVGRHSLIAKEEEDVSQAEDGTTIKLSKSKMKSEGDKTTIQTSKLKKF